MQIQLGQKVKCIVTGVQGIAVCRASYLYGIDRFDIQQPMKKDKTLPEAYTIDENQLIIIDKKRVIECKEPKVLIELGQKILDPISNIEGVAIGQALYLNGCRRILLAPKKGKDNKLSKSVWFDEPQLKIINKRPLVKISLKDTGGPPPMKPNRNY